MKIDDELVSVFCNYVCFVEQELKKLKESLQSKQGVIYTSLGEKDMLLRKIKEVESHLLFEELVKASVIIYKGEDKLNQFNMSLFREAARNFFRRSGIYLKCYNGDKLSDPEILSILYNQYDRTFRAQTAKVIYLAPLEGVSFSREALDFSTFLIKRFSLEELSKIVNNRINDLFYPHAVWDIDKLSMYWFLVVEREEDIPSLGHLLVDFTDLFYLRRKLADEISPLKPALYKMILFDWQPRNFAENADKLISYSFRWSDVGIKLSIEEVEKLTNERGWGSWFGLRIPMIGKISNNLRDCPPAAPDSTRLEIFSLFNSIGEEIEEPAEWFSQIQENEFKTFIEQLNHLTEKLLSRWPFLRVALDYLTKAFLTEPSPEQLLWHITCVEALLGEKGRGVTRKLKKRLGYILGKNTYEQNIVENTFSTLYRIRCDLVHGDEHWDAYSPLNLLAARNLARQACLWFCELARKYIEKNNIPPVRDCILKSIDRNRCND